MNDPLGTAWELRPLDALPSQTDAQMPRAARIVIPGVPHHVIQRGNRQQRLFLTHGDCRRYVEMLAEACRLHDVPCLA
jgi:hypothetical protein